MKTSKPPRELLKKSHAHESKKDFARKGKHRVRHSDEWADHFSGMSNLKQFEQDK